MMINLCNGWLVNLDEISTVQPIKNSGKNNKSTVTLKTGLRLHTPLTTDQIAAQFPQPDRCKSETFAV